MEFGMEIDHKLGAACILHTIFKWNTTKNDDHANIKGTSCGCNITIHNVYLGTSNKFFTKIQQSKDDNINRYIKLYLRGKYMYVIAK
jgi:hypothetical protein